MQTILKHEDGRSKVGNLFRLRIFKSAEVVQQAHPCFPLFSLIPKYNSNPILEIFAKDSLKGSLSFGESFGVSGNEKTLDLKAVSDVDGDYQTFQDFFDDKLKGKNLCVETLNMNGVTRIFNPVRVESLYQITADYFTENTYEFSFNPTKFKDYALLDIIKTVAIETRYYASIALSDCTVILQDYCEESAFKYGYSLTDDVNTAIFFNQGILPKFQALSDGKYYFFAVNKLAPEIFDSYLININISEIINTDIENEFSVDGDLSNNNFNGSVDGDITTN